MLMVCRTQWQKSGEARDKTINDRFTIVWSVGIVTLKHKINHIGIKPYKI